MKTKKAAVLNIESDVITLVLQDNRYANNFIWKGQAAYDGYMDGEFYDVEALYEAIRGLVSECEAVAFIKLDEILLGVPGDFTTTVCRTVAGEPGGERKFTPGDVDSLFQKANRYAGNESYVSINASPIYFTIDGRDEVIDPVGHTGSRLSAYMSYVVCERSFTEIFDSIAEALELKFTYTSAVLAEVLYILPDDMRDKGVILVDAGFIATTVAYAKGDGMLDCRSFSLGSGQIAADLVRELDIPYHHALALIAQLNLNIAPESADQYHVGAEDVNFGYPAGDVNAVAQGRIEEIADAIKEAVDLFRVDPPKDTEIILTGSGLTHIPGAKECIAKIAGRTTDTVRPDLLSFNKPSQSSTAGLILVQQRQIIKKKFFGSGFSRFIDKFRRKK